MRFSEILRLVWVDIMENKFKVMLTSLGIIVGSATIVLVIVIGHGGEVDVQNQFKNLNAGSINAAISAQADIQDQMTGGSPDGGMSGSGGGAMPGGGTMPGGGFTVGGGGDGGSVRIGGGAGGFSGGNMDEGKQSVRLFEEDLQNISDLVPRISMLTIYASSTASVEDGNLTEETDETVVGVLSNYQEITNLEPLQGSFISDDDETDKSETAVIGYAKAQEVYGSAYAACGESITLEGKTYEIVGVFSSVGTVSSSTSPDDSIFIPYSTAVKYIFGNDTSLGITVIAEDANDVLDVMANISTVLQEDRENANFRITDAGSSMEAATASANTLSMLLVAVAYIVSLVDGIGTMSVLFVSVKERTQEIGILKTLGCSERKILLQFLSEANFISVFDGVVGVVLGFLVVPLLRLTGMTIEPLAISGVYSMLFAVVTGTILGLYPAWKAASLMPIGALSQE